ncbi:hypothetical protein [Sulfitobacter sp. 20_GPM-1509m]
MPVTELAEHLDYPPSATPRLLTILVKHWLSSASLGHSRVLSH